MIKGVLASNTVAMVTYCVTKMIIMCSPMVGQFFDTMIVASSNNALVIGFPEGGGDPGLM